MPPRDERLADFEAQRPRLLRLAYRMTGSVTEAEDVLQDAWLRWAQVEGGVDVPGAYLTRIVTRLCLDRIKSARARRETYVGAWLPEPLIGMTEQDEIVADDVTLTLMIALERLSPLERAAFLLHDMFGIPLSEVAVILNRDAAAVRQIASRARKHVQVARPRYIVAAEDADRIARAFFVAARDGDAAALTLLLTKDIEIHSDGGGKVLAFRNVIRGLDRALRLFKGLSSKHDHRPELLRTVIIDGLPGYVSIDRGKLLQTTALDIRGGKIVAVFIVRNPEKLRHVAEMVVIAETRGSVPGMLKAT